MRSPERTYQNNGSSTAERRAPFIRLPGAGVTIFFSKGSGKSIPRSNPGVVRCNRNRTGIRSQALAPNRRIASFKPSTCSEPETTYTFSGGNHQTGAAPTDFSIESSCRGYFSAEGANVFATQRTDLADDFLHRHALGPLFADENRAAAIQRSLHHQLIRQSPASRTAHRRAMLLQPSHGEAPIPHSEKSET